MLTAAESRTLEAFREKYNREPEILVTAPGRVNLIGEHTDYNEGFVFPAAIDRGLTVALSARPNHEQSELTSLELGDAEPFDATTVNPEIKPQGWAGYAAGMAWVLRDIRNAPMPNVRGIVHSTVPIGSGVSSSAALEVAFGLAWELLTEVNSTDKVLAKLAQRCENEFVGMRSGIMDQMASACGKANRAMFLDTLSLDIEYVSVPETWRIVLCDTAKPRALTASAYNERRSQCETVARLLGKPSLRTVTIADLDHANLDPLLYKRAHHVVSENDRCLAFRLALAASNERQVGALMRASHESLRDDYAVSCAELDAMAEIAWSAPSCIGARMTGAGFGGACVAFVREDSIQEFGAEVLPRYHAATGLTGSLLVCALAEGARRVDF